MHRGTQRELVQQPRRFSKKDDEEEENRSSRAIYTPNTSALARSSPRRHVTTSPRPRCREDGGGRVSNLKRSRPVAQQSPSGNESVEVGTAEELFSISIFHRPHQKEAAAACVRGRAALSQRLICNPATQETLTHPGRRTLRLHLQPPTGCYLSPQMS